MQPQTTVRYHFTPSRLTTRKTNHVKINKTEGNKCWQRCGEIETLKKLNIERTYDLATPPLDRYQKGLKAGTQTYVCTSVFLAATRWKPPKCPSNDEQINNMWYSHRMKYYSALKKERNCDSCYHTDKPRRHYAELQKTGTKEQMMHDSTYRTQNRQIHGARKQCCQRLGRGWGRWRENGS